MAQYSEKIEAILQRVPSLDQESAHAARCRQNSLTKPCGSLGRLEELSVQLTAITGQPQPRLRHNAVIVMAADHGVVAEGVSAYPQQVTAQMVHNFLSGGAAINVLASHIGARVLVVDMGVAADLGSLPGLVHNKIAYGTANFATQPAMTRQQALQAIEAGIDIIAQEVEQGLDIVAIGDMGIGNTTASAAIGAALIGCSPTEIAGRGTGISDERLRAKIRVIETALDRHQPNREDAIDVLSKVGGFEIGGLLGVTLAAAAHRVPIVMDGFISTAAALLAVKICPAARDYLIAGHLSAEHGHRLMLDYLGLQPVLTLDLRLGEGTGAVLAIGLCEAAAKVLAEMASFDDAGVSRSDEHAEG